MKNKYLIGILFSFLLVPSIAFASWWNPFSWFNSWTFNKEVTPVVQVEQKLEEPPISQTGNETIPPAGSEQPKPKAGSPKPVVSKPVITTPTIIPTAIDVCLNIEGVQPQPPLGFSSVSNICTLIAVNDYCPNLVGIQSSIPVGKIFYKNTNECLTANEIAVKENSEAQKENQEENCQEAKEDVVLYREELAEAQETYQEEYDRIKENPNGVFAGALTQELFVLGQEFNSQEQAIYAKISIAQAEVQLYCD